MREAGNTLLVGGRSGSNCCGVIQTDAPTVLHLCLRVTSTDTCTCLCCLQISSCDASFGFCKDNNDTTRLQLTPHEGLVGLLLGGARPLRWPGPDPDARPGGLSLAPVRQATALYALDSTITDVRFSDASGTCRCVSSARVKPPSGVNWH